MEINFTLGKNGGHRPSSLGGRLIVVVRQAGGAGGWAGGHLKKECIEINNLLQSVQTLS